MLANKGVCMNISKLSTVSERIAKASEVLKASDTTTIEKILKEIGIEKNEMGLNLLNSDVATYELLESSISSVFNGSGLLLVKTAVKYLKGVDPFCTHKEEISTSSSDPDSNALIQYIRANKPVQQMSDSELMGLWDKNKDPEVENELSKRAKGQAFIVLIPGTYMPGKENIDIELSLELLKSARKRNNPTIIPYIGNTFASVYKINELNLNDRIIEICPICGEILWKGYCESCNSSFAGVGDDERAYVKLIVDSGKIQSNSVSDRKAIVVSAAKGIDDLKVTWPGIYKTFEELKLTGNLPKLRKIANRPATLPVQDPFNVSGNRKF
jgi:hypothetical protein